MGRPRRDRTIDALPDDLARAIREDYRYDASPFCREDTELREAKRVLDGMDPGDRQIMLIYAEVGNVTSLAQVLGVGRSTAAAEINRIRTEIFTRMRNDWENDD